MTAGVERRDEWVAERATVNGMRATEGRVVKESVGWGAHSFARRAPAGAAKGLYGAPAPAADVFDAAPTGNAFGGTGTIVAGASFARCLRAVCKGGGAGSGSAARERQAGRASCQAFGGLGPGPCASAKAAKELATRWRGPQLGATSTVSGVTAKSSLRGWRAAGELGAPDLRCRAGLGLRIRIGGWLKRALSVGPRRQHHRGASEAVR